MFIVVHRPAHTLSDIVKLHQEGGQCLWKDSGNFFPTGEKDGNDDWYVDVYIQYTANIIGDNFTK